MASIVRSKISGISGSGNNGNGIDAAAEGEKYKLTVTAGPSYDQSQHKTLEVNGPTPVYIENEFVRAKVKVRIRGFHGLPTTCPATSTYFDDPLHAKDLYSVAFSFVPKQDLPSVDTVWGNDFDHPVRNKLPPGFNTAFKIVKEFIDPGLECDAYADEPWMYGPSLSCWFAFRIGDRIEPGANFPAPDDEQVLKEGGDGEGQEVRQKLGLPASAEKRRKYFLSAQHRQDFVFEKDRLYQADFYNPYLDFAKTSLKLPGFSLNVIKYVDQKSHSLRYVFKNRKSGDVYINVNIHLLFGEQLKRALDQDRERRNSSEGAVSNVAAAAGVNGAASADDGAKRSASAPHATIAKQDGHTSEKPPRAASTTPKSTPKKPQLHPGDQNAAAGCATEHGNHAASGNDDVNNISRMLQNTSTGSAQGVQTGMFDDGVD